MSNYKFYILTSSNLKYLKRHFQQEFSNIPKEMAVVVINTRDNEYEAEASAWCENQGIEYHITDSNGTPARGKNELIKIFLKSEQDYMVQIDSDDFLTPHGVWMYEEVSKQESPPDAIALKHQISLIPEHDKIQKLFESGAPESQWKGEDAPWKATHYFTANWDAIEQSSIYSPLISMGLDERTAKKYAKYHKEFYRLQKKYCEHNESHCRVTWLSKKAVKEHRFPEDLLIGEDTVFYFYLKNSAINGELDVLCNDEIPPTYIYDQRSPGIVHHTVGDGTNWQWMGDYNTAVRKLEKKGIVHEKDLPLLKVDYPWDYYADVCGLQDVSLQIFTFSDTNSEGVPFEGQLSAPANSSQKSLMERYERYYKFYK